MQTLGARFAAAIAVSGKSREQIAAEAGTMLNTISRIASGSHDNPELQLLIRLAGALNTSVGAPSENRSRSPAKTKRCCCGFAAGSTGGWRPFDAEAEATAVIVEDLRHAPRAAHVAEQPFKHVQLILSAVGDSMVGDGIRPLDTIYAAAARSLDAVIGKIVACEVNGKVFVKRLVREHKHFFLASAHPRYRPIALTKSNFELLGLVVGRTGSVD